MEPPWRKKDYRVVEQLMLSVVDQSPVRDGDSAGDALRDTIELAAVVEKLGYQRYWLAEHHSIANFAGTSPEILIGHVAARTKTIRVGSGGVMLSHYSAFKVAENFRMLEALYPGRIDLGIGRAPGSDQLTNAALSYPNRPADISHFPQQVTDVLGHLGGSLDAGHIFAGIRAGPVPTGMPHVWLLGSRQESAYMAASLGLPFAYAHFFGLGVEEGPQIVDGYRKSFKPSEYLSEPKVNIGVQVLCADTEEAALRIASSRNLARLKSVTGRARGVPTIEEALAYEYAPNEVAYTQQYTRLCVDGAPEQVKERLDELAEMYQTQDLSIVTICYAFADRVRSYELVAQVCGLEKGPDSC